MGEYRIAVDVVESRSTFVVVRLRALDEKTARQVALAHVDGLCRMGTLDDCMEAAQPDWEHDNYSAEGTPDVKHIEDYVVDIDLVDGDETIDPRA